MKKYFSPLYKLILHFLVYISCYFNFPGFCDFIIKISLFKNKFLKKKIKSKKIFIVLYREIGIRDLEIVHDSSNSNFEFLFLKRSITKIILYYFCNRKKSFIDYLNNPVNMEDYFTQNINNKKRHEEFWTNIILYLKKYFNNKNLNLITFNYSYYAEAALYAGCKKIMYQLKCGIKKLFKQTLMQTTR